MSGVERGFVGNGDGIGGEMGRQKTPGPAGGTGVLANGGVGVSGSEIPLVLVQIADAGGEELDAGGEVLFVAGFDGLVDVAGGDGDGPGDRAAGDHALEAGGIGAAGREDFRLPLDFVFFGGGLHEGDHAVIADDRGIHELDGRAFAEGGAAFLRGGAGDVVGDGGVQAEAEVRLDLEGGCLGAAEADFLLDGEDGVEIVGGFGFALS